MQSRASLITFLGFLALLVVINLKMIMPYVLTVFMGGILALLSHGVYHRLLRPLKGRRKIAAFVVTIGILVLIIGPISAFITTAVKQGIGLAQHLTRQEGFSFDGILARLTDWGPVQTMIGDAASIERQARSALQSLGRGLSGAVLAIAAALPNMGMHLALALICCFFFLIDGRRFLAWVSNKIPLDQDVRLLVMKSFEDTTISTIWATLAAAATQAAMMTGGYLLLGVPAAFLAGGATFIFAWIPVLGSVPVWLAGAVYLFTQGAVAKAVAMIVLGLVTTLTDNFVRPWVLKGRGDMHPLVALVAIFGGIYKFGIFGVFYGPILAAILISLLQVWPVVGARSGLRFEGRAVREGKEQLQEAKKAS